MRPQDCNCNNFYNYTPDKFQLFLFCVACMADLCEDKQGGSTWGSSVWLFATEASAKEKAESLTRLTGKEHGVFKLQSSCRPVSQVEWVNP